MVEKLILDYLTETLDVPVHMEKPEPPPDSYVLIEKTGAGENNHIQSATLAVQSYAPSLYLAAVLSRRVVEAMQDAVTVPNLSRVALNNEYNYTDTSKKGYRYQAVFDVIFHE